jgi:hypothetical protein
MRMRRTRAQIQRRLRSREGPTYLVGAAVVVLVSSGGSRSRVIMEVPEGGEREEGSAGERGGSELDASAASVPESARGWASSAWPGARGGRWKW